MTETSFSIKDLFRRRLQTSLTVLSITVCVASTLFLLLFSGQIGIGISATTQQTLTAGISNIFAQIMTFIGALIFTVGAIIVSFTVFLMMVQRTKDYGLMKATGCPNGLVFGYFFTELLTVVFVGCILGLALGFATDYLIINLPMFQVYNKAPNLWFAPIVFVVYLMFALIFGAKPILDAARMSPLKAISQVQYFGLGKGTALKPLSRSALTMRLASRSLFRRKTATVRIVLFLSVVFLLLTVSIAGGMIADDTSSSWLRNATGEKVLLIADASMANQYSHLLLKFSNGKVTPTFSYLDPQLGIPDSAIQEIRQMPWILNVDARLVWRSTIQEVPGFKIDPATLATIPLGDHRQSDAIIIGINAETAFSQPYIQGWSLNLTSSSAAVVGDSIALSVYSPIFENHPFGKITTQADPLRQGVKVGNATFTITGIGIDPLNNGNVTYVPLKQLQTITGASSPNIVLVAVDPSVDYASAASQTRAALRETHPTLTVTELDPLVTQNGEFLGSLWSIIMFLPSFALAAASLCLVGFLLVSIDEQRQEFAILRATGAKPKSIIAILGFQSLIVLLSSFAVGTSLGIILCIVILIAEPVVLSLTIIAISGWLLVALAGMFLISLYPALKFSRKPLLSIMS